MGTTNWGLEEAAAAAVGGVDSLRGRDAGAPVGRAAVAVAADAVEAGVTRIERAGMRSTAAVAAEESLGTATQRVTQLHSNTM